MANAEEVLNAPDEDILSGKISEFDSVNDSEDTEEVVGNSETDEEDLTAVEDEEDSSTNTADDGNDSEAEESEPESEEEDSEETEEVIDTSDSETDEKDSSDKKEDTINYEAEYKRLLSPFKANGHELKVDNVDEAITLMQMGANYNKKMAALKPHLKTVKILQKNGIDSEEKLAFLIDLHRKDKQAIAKLIKDSGVDPLELESEDGEDNAYTPSNYNVSDQELAIEEVLDSLQESPYYNRLITTVGKEWDAPSKRIISETPQLLNILHSHMETGVFDIIQKEIIKQRALGNLNGLNDLEAYKQIGDGIQARGGFDHLTKVQSKNSVSTSRPSKLKEEDQKLKAKRRAAAPTKQTPKSRPSSDFNPLNLSDEEFEKQFNQRLL